LAWLIEKKHMAISSADIKLGKKTIKICHSATDTLELMCPHRVLLATTCYTAIILEICSHQQHAAGWLINCQINNSANTMSRDTSRLNRWLIRATSSKLPVLGRLVEEKKKPNAETTVCYMLLVIDYSFQLRDMQQIVL
jgi:hypothetical protein